MTQPATLAWLDRLQDVYSRGHHAAPRGMAIKELLCCTSIVDMNYPIVDVPGRDLGFKFMAAEAAWILSGDNRVSTIKPYARHIENFSDDGQFFYGAYGPRVIDQLPYVARVLAEDPDTRQAVLTIWRPSPPKTKDVPCTVSVQWFIREGTLHCLDTMRSSDLWLGWPYDIFNFSMLSHYLRLILKARYGVVVEVGSLFLTAGSQHIYEKNFEKIEAILVEQSHGKTEHVSVGVQPVMNKLWEPQELVDLLWRAANEDGAKDAFGAP